ncbi:MAG TPA: M48 family metalloprotease [Candidatus Acidoferrales bacterium]|jgi:predicted Zn-dependent protease|nr:M48 family metalloprotease [Candidatus Acidoferrales bacterium]
MKNSFAAQWVATLLATSLLAVPGFAAPRGQQNSPSQTQTQASQPQASPSQTPQTQSPQPQGSQPQATQPQSSSDDNTIPSPENPNVKPGSKADVNAIGNRDVGKGLDFYSLEKEIALGKQLAQEVDKSAKFITDPVITEYVNRVGQNLVRNSDARVPFTIKVIDSDVVNAFALPGGFFYVNSGVILHADEESEMAGVMAHEIAHVAARHGTKQATKGDIMQIASIPAMIFIPYTWAGYAIYQGMNFMIPVTFLKFSRDAEREADYLGLQYMYKAGYDPNAFVAFFEKVEADEKKQPGTIPKVFSTHPPTPDRIEATQKEIATILPARDEYIVTTSEFDMVKHRLEMIESNQKVKAASPNKPTLRRRTDENKGGSTTAGGTDPNSTSTSAPADTGSDDDRPTLKRRTDDNQ